MIAGEKKVYLGKEKRKTQGRRGGGGGQGKQEQNQESGRKSSRSSTAMNGMKSKSGVVN